MEKNHYIHSQLERRENELFEADEPNKSKSSMTIAITVTAVIGLTLTLYDYPCNKDLGLAYTVLSCVICMFIPWYLVVAIHKMGNGLGANGVVNKFGVWGFMWRLYITWAVSGILILLLMPPFYQSYTITQSIATSLISSLLICLCGPCVIWVFFSNNRRQQIHWISGLLSRF